MNKARIDTQIKKLNRILSLPLSFKSRCIVLIISLLIPLSFISPLWKIGMVAPQYPEGLSLYIYPHKVEGGNNNNDIQEINTLNHYIGMRSINRAELTDLDWIPFAIGAMFILTLRLVFLGTLSGLIDLFVISTYIGLFSLVRFYFKLYSFGHNLDPGAPVIIEPFTPVLLGSKQVANFYTSSFPTLGTFCIGIFVLTIGILIGWGIFSNWKKVKITSKLKS